MTNLARTAVVTLATLVLAAGLATPGTASDLVAHNGAWVTPQEAAELAAAEPEAVATLDNEATLDSERAPTPQWGAAATSMYAVGACGAGSRDATHTYQATNCTRVEPIPAGTSTSVGWQVHLPTGALITSVRMHYFDNIASEPSVGFYRVTNTGARTSVVGLSPGAFAGGNATYTATLTTPHQVTNSGAGYQILAIIDRTGATTTHGIYGFEASYQLQVSAAPATATFPTDVPTTHPFFRYIEALAASGVTAGCGAGLYCPDSPVTRGQMAVFLSVALGLHFPN